MATYYKDWNTVVEAFTTNELDSLCFELDYLFEYPVRFVIRDEQARDFVTTCVRNKYPFPLKAHKLDLYRLLYIGKPKCAS
jgi:hypothetical protein